MMKRDNTRLKLPLNKTKIVCTIGPSSASPEVMEKMIRAGMNIARLNFSHGDFESHRTVINNLRKAARTAGTRIAIMGDLAGPKMRIGKLAQEPVDLKPDDSFVLTTDDIIGDAGRCSVTFKRLPRTVKPGDTLFLNDGIIQLDVSAFDGDDVICRVIVGGELRSHKGLNFPGIKLGISAFTERDHTILKFAAEEGLDAVSQSFVETGADIRAVRQAADALGYHPFIIAKIERSNALDHMDDILDAADGIMIATQRRMVSVRDLYQGIDIKSNLKLSHLITIAIEASLEYASAADVAIRTIEENRIILEIALKHRYIKIGVDNE